MSPRRSKLKRLFLLPLLAATAAACHDRDLPSGLERAPTDAYPTADQIELACAQHEVQARTEGEKASGTSSVWEIGWTPVRRASCRWEDGTTATALCRFQKTLIASDLDREVLLRSLLDRD